MLRKTWYHYLAFLLAIFPASSFHAQENETPKIEIGGALRFNYNYSNWVKNSKKEGGEFGYDVFRINAKGSYKGLIFDAEYRFYAKSSGGGMLKHGWIGYDFTPHHQIQVGLNTVPFGMSPYQSNNWFFNINYYLGKEDDADMGLKYTYNKNDWEVNLAFYKNSDILDFHSDQGINPSRYSYDVAGRNKEINQGNLRIIKKWSESRMKHELGASAEVGGLYNLDTQKTGGRQAFAIHYVGQIDHWTLRAQATTYSMSPKNADFISTTNAQGHTQLIPNPEKGAGYVEMGAYGANYHVATKADTYIFDVAYNIPVNKGILDSVTFYNDFGMMHKRIPGMQNSYQNVTGVLLAMGPIFTYLDYALGNNHAWLGPEWTDAFAKGGDGNKWTARLNLNLGYYF